MAERELPLWRRGLAPLAPLQQAAQYLAELTGWRRRLAAWLLGVLAAAALPPVDLTPVLVISFGGLVWLAEGSTTRRSAFGLGWWFGVGFFLAGLYWIAAALFVDIAQFWWLVPFAALGVPIGFGLFTGAATLASFAAGRAFRLGPTGRILMLAVCWAVAEWLRGHILTGFPWNLLGYAWSGAFPGSLAVLQSTALIGIYGLSLLTVLAAALPARLGAASGRRWPPVIVAGLLIAVPAAGGALRLRQPRPGDVPGVTLRLVQPSLPQTLINGPDAVAAEFRRLAALSTMPGGDKVTAIIWPEGEGPPYLAREPQARAALAQVAPPHGYLITGTVRTDPPPARPVHIWNTLVALDQSGTIRASYDKAHLVPFGEYVPLSGILPMQKITAGAVDFSAGPGPRTITLPGLPPFGPLICYEAIFPGAVVDPAERPKWLLNITNDAWYGFTSGPFQDLDISRVRAVEEGLPLVRVGNNGVSAVIDPYGRLLRRLDLDEVGVLDVALPNNLPPTPYSRWGEKPYAGMLLLIMAAAFISSRKQTIPL